MRTWAHSKWTLDSVPKRVLIYVLSGYVLIQFVWWAYMLVDLNSEAYHLRLELLTRSEMPAPEAQIQKTALDAKLSQRVWMVLGEGAVFVFILVLGFRALQRSISRELELSAQQKNFLLSVTHELKSPLAAIKLQLQTLAGRSLSDEKRHQIYVRALADTERLQGLVENLLLVNRVEAGKFPLEMKRTDISELTQQLIKRHFASELEKGVLTIVFEAGLWIACDHQAMESIVINLIENAQKYAVSSNIDIRIGKQGHSIMLSVADQGPGIPDIEKERVFQRFFRLGNEDTRSTKGTGIGLYLVRQLVEMQHGTIHVKDNVPKGTSFEVRLPAQQE
jgi:two-component system phosphate regulon sensor histidine kinase PhoR